MSEDSPKEETKGKLEQLIDKEGITLKEAETLLKSSRKKPSATIHLSFPSKHIKYAYMSDTHIGHLKFSDELYEKFVQTCKREGVDFVVHPGDHLEGMSGRPGHIYELSEIGFQNQIAKAQDLYRQIPVPIYGIDGNHDQWYFNKNNGGMVVGKELEARVNNYHHLGQDEGDLELAPGITIKLFHGNDGAAYATSYKLQKLIESFSESEKPAILHSGHYHKALYMYLRGIHGFESGTLCAQSKFMRGKKIAANMGFGVVDVFYDKKGIDRIDHTFTGYEPPLPKVTKR